MDISSFINLIKNKFDVVLTITILAVVVTLIISFIEPRMYKSESKILIVQTSTSLDAYQAAKSAQSIGEVLTEVLYTSSFRNQVFSSGFNIDKSYFGSKPKDIIKRWKKTISANVTSDTGIMNIRVFHKNQNQAHQIAQGISNVFIAKGYSYHGRGEAVYITMIDAPIIADKPFQPRPLRNGIISCILGLILGCGYVYWIGEKESRQESLIDLLGKRDREKKESKLGEVTEISKETPEKSLRDQDQFQVEEKPKEVPSTFSSLGEIIKGEKQGLNDEDRIEDF